MTLTVLSDGDVRELLHALTLEDVERLQRRLAEALHEYSTGTAGFGCSSTNQPARTVLKTADGTTTLFMPARTGATAGVKIVTLANPQPEDKKTDGLKSPARVDTGSSGAKSPSRSATDSPKGPSRTASERLKSPSRTTTGTSSGTSAPRIPIGDDPGSDTDSSPADRSSLAAPRPSSSPSASFASLKLALRGGTSSDSRSSESGSTLVGTPPTSGRSSPAPPPAMPPSLPALANAAAPDRRTSPQGSLTLLRATGEPLALINAAELTAFRTALASTLLFSKRSRAHSICVFGAGKQAYWHLRLALILRGAEIHHVRLINRSFEGAAPLLRAIYEDAAWTALRTANPKLSFSLLSADYGEYERLLKAYVRDADAIFCCTPATAPLFPGGHLTRAEGRRKGRYLALVGSYAADMCEVDPAVLQQAVAPDHGHHHHRHAAEGGVVVVDGLDACLREAGEIIGAGIGAAQLVELGELIMVKRAAKEEMAMGKPGEPGLTRWLESGNVVYKSVGLGLMDLAVGEVLVEMAGEKGVGSVMGDF